MLCSCFCRYVVQCFYTPDHERVFLCFAAALVTRCAPGTCRGQCLGWSTRNAASPATLSQPPLAAVSSSPAAHVVPYGASTISSQYTSTVVQQGLLSQRIIGVVRCAACLASQSLPPSQVASCSPAPAVLQSAIWCAACLIFCLTSNPMSAFDRGGQLSTDAVCWATCCAFNRD